MGPKTGGTCTLPKFKIAPEKVWLEDDPFLLGWYIFRGELLNFGRVNYALPPFLNFFCQVPASADFQVAFHAVGFSEGVWTETRPQPPG